MPVECARRPCRCGQGEGPQKDADFTCVMNLPGIGTRTPARGACVRRRRGQGDERQFTGYVKKYRLAKRSAAQDMLMPVVEQVAHDEIV